VDTCPFDYRFLIKFGQHIAQGFVEKDAAIRAKGNRRGFGNTTRF
jgi:hypothetical protein